MQIPKQGIDIGLHGAPGDRAVKSKAHLIEPSAAVARAEHSLDGVRPVGGERFHARDHRIVLLLDVAEVGEFLCHLDDELDGRQDVGRASRSLNEHGPLRQLAKRAEVRSEVIQGFGFLGWYCSGKNR